MTRFPDEFVWGASTASYQIEGAVREDGRGESIWDRFSHTPGKTANGDTGDVATDHYHRWREDVALMRELGLDAYRFSVAWPRVQPEGRGAPNRKGLDFYDRLVDGLLDAGIEPWACLYHWDLPQALQDAGGWPARDTAERFADYGEIVAERLGDRVRHWIMVNEANVAALLGHLLGLHAPGVQDPMAFAAATHHLNLATGLGIERLRALDAGRDWRLGTVVNLEPVHPATDSEEDANAAAAFDALRNRAYLDPLLRGAYPELAAGMIEPHVREGDLAVMSRPMDLLGLNLYSRAVVRADPASLVGISQVEPEEGVETTAMGWEVRPESLYEQLMELTRDYDAPPLYVTENGAAFPDGPGPEGRRRDPRRVAFLARHLDAVARAIEDGADVRGYFVWSLTDNFEWAEGYAKRFGLVHVDYDTLERTPRDSYRFYADVVRDGGFDLERVLQATGGRPDGGR